MTYLKLICICLCIISCSDNIQTDETTTPNGNNEKDTLANKASTEIVTRDTNSTIETIEGKTITYQGYEFIIGESSKEEFFSLYINTTYHIVNDKQCVIDKRIVINSDSIDIRLTNGDYLTLKNKIDDEQFLGYSFLHYNSELNNYVLWENWLEAGHPIMVNGTTGKVTSIYGEIFATNKKQTLTANVAADIGAGWTPNGIQVFEIQNNNYYQLFEFDPTLVLNEEWGPIDVRWKNDNTILLECIRHNEEGGHFTFYKMIQFKDLGKPDNFYR
jgi:hypothetical protein